MNWRRFEEFEREGIIRKQSPDKNRTMSILNGADNKKKFLDLILTKIPIEQENPNFIVDNCYDIIVENIRSIMLLKGLKASGNFAHEAEVSYLQVLGFSDLEIKFLDEMRYYRNGIKYYETILDLGYAKKVLAFFNKIYPKLRKVTN